jgi:phosphoribosylformimino-5-aminoimidazole carboxamide ribotide isomerase
MLIIPAIDLYDRKCVRLYQGQKDKITVYSNDPLATAKRWEDCGARQLHVVDLDGAFDGVAKNLDIVLEIQRQTSLTVEMGGGIRSAATVKERLESGIDQVILGTMAQKSVSVVQSLSQQYPRRIILGIDARNGFVSVQGWTEQSSVAAVDLIDSYNGFPLASLIFTDIARDGTLDGPNLESLKTVISHTDIPVVASGGISDLSDLEKINDCFGEQLYGVILGKSLYDNRIDLSEAIRIFQRD